MLKEKRLDAKYKKPLTKKQLREACKAPLLQTKLKMRKGFQAAPLFYYVLMTHQLNEVDKKIVTKGLLHAITPLEAKELVLTQPGWMFRDISLIKDFECGVLMYKGLAVALYYKRQVSKIEPEPYEPVPSGALENPKDVWARLDLFSKSPRQLVADAQEELLLKDQEIIELKQQLEAMKVLNASFEVKQKKHLMSQLRDTQSQLSEANTKIAALEKQLRSHKK